MLLVSSVLSAVSHSGSPVSLLPPLAVMSRLTDDSVSSADKTEDTSSNAAVTYKLTLDKTKVPGTLPENATFKVTNYSDSSKNQEIAVSLTTAVP